MSDSIFVSAILLAGGLSSRMKRCKAELLWDGTTLIEYQIKKIQSLGITDILVSGYSKPLCAAEYVPDIYPQKGPLSGIHAGLLAAENEHCLVMSVDTPLVPARLCSDLIGFHLSGHSLISIVSHGEFIEPLMGVYSKQTAGKIEEILQTDSTSVRRIFETFEPSLFRFHGDAALLCDCNTAEEYTAAVKYSSANL